MNRSGLGLGIVGQCPNRQRWNRGRLKGLYEDLQGALHSVEVIRRHVRQHAGQPFAAGSPQAVHELPSPTGEAGDNAPAVPTVAAASQVAPALQPGQDAGHGGESEAEGGGQGAAGLGAIYVEGVEHLKLGHGEVRPEPVQGHPVAGQAKELIGEVEDAFAAHENSLCHAKHIPRRPGRQDPVPGDEWGVL